MPVKTSDVIEDVSIATGIGISLIDIQQILSIILLCFELAWILFKVIMKVYKHYTDDGKLDAEESEYIENTISEYDNKRKK